MNEAVKLRFIPNNPCDFVTLPHKVRPEYTFYTDVEINTMLDKMKSSVLYPIIRITCFYGLRRSEALGLKWNAIDFGRNMLTIKHTVVEHVVIVEKDRTKNASSYRSFPLTADVCNMLLSLKATEEENRRLFGKEYQESDYIFKWDTGKSFNPNYITKTFGKLLKQYNLPHIRFHDLRHSCGSLLLSQGFGLKDVQEWLGHADITMTANVYGHLDLARKQSIAEHMSNTLAR
jgi:integrase